MIELHIHNYHQQESTVSFTSSKGLKFNNTTKNIIDENYIKTGGVSWGLSIKIGLGQLADGFFVEEIKIPI